jgi:DNA (cytosine-5)-methyltransferase 1
MRFLSVCSGIEAASVAWNPLGWEASAFAEIEPFPCAVLAHHYPEVPNRGDMTKFEEWPIEPIDLLCGGTPCQSFSVAGLRKGLDDPRGNLMLTFGAIAARHRPRWLVWENVPGVLSSNGGGDFGTFLGMLGQLGYGFAYRVLDAQYFGVPQRRRRVFVVGCLGDWRSAAAVLFERHSVSGHPAPRRGEGQRPAPTLSARTQGGGGLGTDFDCDGGLVAATLDASYGRLQGASGQDANHGHSHLVPVAFGWQNSAAQGDSASESVTPTLDKSKTPAVAVGADCFNGRLTGDVASTMGTRGSSINSSGPTLLSAMQVRRLTPTECEALQGFARNYTLVPFRGKPASDGPRYKALGNSWAVPCARWIGERIQQVEAIQPLKEAA